VVNITSSDIGKALRERYAAPEYALFFEVANGTGSNIRRYADAMAMSLFPSRGLTMHGFEVKVSRSDWKRELDNPRKAEEGNFRYCDHWWIVTTPNIVQPGELPKTWGHLELQTTGDIERGFTSKLKLKVPAPVLDAEQMSRNFIAALLRRADEANKAEIRYEVMEQTSVLRKQLDDVQRDNEAAIREAVDTRTERHRELVETVRQFEQVSGIKLLTSYGKNEAEWQLLKALRAAGHASTYDGLESLAKRLETASAGIRSHLIEFNKLAEPTKESESA